MVKLSQAERDGLGEALRTTGVRRHWVRVRAVWLAAEGRPVPEIAADLGAGASSVFAWLAQCRTTGDPAALADAPRSGRPPALDDPLRGQLEALLAVPPEVHGHHTTGWTVPLLHHHFTTVLRAPVSEWSCPGETALPHCDIGGDEPRRLSRRLGYLSATRSACAACSR